MGVIRAAYREAGDTTPPIDTSVFLQIKGIFRSDAVAGQNGVAIGEAYEVAQINDYGMPWGMVKIRREP